jgi:Sulfatase-modifying factor enzyme 1
MKIQIRFLSFSITFLTLVLLNACSSSSIDWVAQDDLESFQIIAPTYQNESIEPYRNIKILNQAVSEAIASISTPPEEGEEDKILYQNLTQVNWILDEERISNIWKLFQKEKNGKVDPLLASSHRARIVDYFESTEFKGRILTLRIVKEEDKPTGYLKGVRIIYLSEDEMDFNRFSIPFDFQSAQLNQELKEIITKLLTTLDYISPGFGPMSFVRIEEGCLPMGLELNDEACVNGFKMARFPITKTQWNQIMLQPEAQTAPELNAPAVGMNWNEIQVFVEKLNDLMNLSFRIPTGYEWEFACRSGRKDFEFGTVAGKIDHTLAAYTRFSEGKIPRGIMETDAFPPNRLGLYDMSGNTWDWVEDRYKSAEKKGLIGRFFDFFSSDIKHRVLRGGSYDSDEEEIKCNSEKTISENIGSRDSGFRLVLED